MQLLNFEMPITVVGGILTIISRINDWLLLVVYL